MASSSSGPPPQVLCDEAVMAALRSGRLVMVYADSLRVGDRSAKIGAQLARQLLNDGRLEQVGHWGGRVAYRLRVPGSNP